MALTLQQAVGVSWVKDVLDIWQLTSSLTELRCFAMWTVWSMVAFCLALVATAWWLAAYVRSLRAQLEQGRDDIANLAGLFSSEIESLRTQLLQSEKDSQSLDETLSAILHGGLPGQLEVVSGDYWSVKMMDVVYTDKKQVRRTWRQSGYQINCFIPAGASDIEVTFHIVGGAPVWQVDRSKHELPWVLDKTGSYKPEKFKYEKCPGHIRYEIRGTSLHAFISHIAQTDMLEGESTDSRKKGKPPLLSFDMVKASAMRQCS